MIDYLDELKIKYGENTPIFLSEIAPDGKENTRIRQYLGRKCKEDKLKQYCRGVYYFPSIDPLFGEISLSPAQIAERKYITDGEEVYGLYSGMTLLNNFGISMQVPNIREIVTERTSCKRTIVIGKTKYVVKKTPVRITKDNYLSIQIAEILKQLTPAQVVKHGEKLRSLIADKKELFKSILAVYPASISKKAIVGGLI